MKVTRDAFFTAMESGMTRGQLRWGVRQGRWVRIEPALYRYGAHEPTALERALGAVIQTGGIASGRLAAMLHGLDAGGAPVADMTGDCAQARRRPYGRRRPVYTARMCVVDGFDCVDGLQTLVDLAALLDDAKWEQALESALRKHLVTIEQLESELPVLGASRVPGTVRIRRVLALRPPGAPPTESLLETLAVQLLRPVASIPEPTRQHEVWDAHDRFVARVDLCWPELGVFLELDGEHHKDQPLYDANRETAVVASTGWLCARLSWTEVVRHPTATTRRLVQVLDQAKRRRFMGSGGREIGVFPRNHDRQDP